MRQKTTQKSGLGLQALINTLYIIVSILFGAFFFSDIMVQIGKPAPNTKSKWIAGIICFLAFVFLQSVPIVTEIIHAILGILVGYFCGIVLMNVVNLIQIAMHIDQWSKSGLQAIVIYIICIIPCTYAFIRYAIVLRKEEKEAAKIEKELHNKHQDEKQ